MRFLLSTAVAALALTMAVPASATLTIVAPCDPTRVNPDAVACAGYYDGNLLGGSPDKVADQNAALDALLGGGGFTPDIVWADIEGTKDFFDLSGGVLNFDSALLGQTIIGIHFGGAGEFENSVSVLYLFNFAAPTTSITLNQDGFSDAVLYRTGGVPEPATWAMMLLGFGAVGFTMRRRRREIMPQAA